MKIKTYVSTAVILALLLSRTAAAISILITTNSNLGFGQLISTSSPGTVVVTPLGIRSTFDGVIEGNSLGVSSSSFSVTGDPDASYSITLPLSATLSGSSSSMTVDTFVSSPSGSGNLGTLGAQIFAVGATLHVLAGQLTDDYSGSYNVSVAYD